MGYACPVCEVPQRDAEHLANHLAFTAMLHGDAHETWLDEHAPGWADGSPDDLGDRVVEFASEAAYDEAFEDTVHAHDHGERAHRHRPAAGEGADAQPGVGRGGDPAIDPGAAARRGGSAPADETRAVLREARELTRRMRAGDDGDDGERETAGGETETGGGDPDADGGGAGTGADAGDDATNDESAGDGGTGADDATGE